MAKEYGTKLTLKDNFSAVIQKAITATEKLKAQLEATEKRLNKMGSKQVKIGAKLDSSVNSSLNKLSDKIPKDKTIHIKAKDDLTRTVTDIKRDIYKMGRDLQMGAMRDPFRGFNSSALRAASNFRMLRGITQGAITGHIMSQMAGTSLAASTAAGAAVGRVAGGIGKPGVLIYGGSSKNKRSGSRYYSDPDYYEVKQHHISLARGDVDDVFDRRRRTLRSFDGDYADMISNQKAVMKNRFGIKNYLSSFRTGDTGGEFAVDFVERQLGKLSYGYEMFKKRMGLTKKGIELKLHFRTEEATRAFQNFKNKISHSKAAEMVIRTKFAAQRLPYYLNNKVATISARLKDSASRGLTNIWSKARNFAGKTFSFSVRAITSGASKALSALMTSIKAISIAAGAIVIGGAVKAVSGASKVEANAVSINHFVKYSNQKDVSEGKASKMTDEEIASKSNAYLGDMRKYAAETPFGDMDVMDAGRRAVTIMDGDLDKAKDLVGIAGDMAALNPGKTIMDAMEALADMKTGEMERMKEFGLKISAEQFKGLVGKGKNDDLSEAEMNKAYSILMEHKLKTMFGGGAKKLSGTISGKWSTLTGTAGSGLADIGTMFAPGIKAGLDKAIAFLNGAGPAFVNAFKPIANAFNNFMTGGEGGVGFFQPVVDAFNKIDFGAMIEKSAAVVKSSFSALVEFAKPVLETLGVIVADIMSGINAHLDEVGAVIDDLRRIWSESWPVLQDIVLTVWSVLEPVFSIIWSAIKDIIDIFTIAWPAISGAVEVVWFVIKPILEAMTAALNGVAWAADKVHDGLTYIINRHGSIDEEAGGGSGDSDGGGDDSGGDDDGGSSDDDSSSERAVGMNYIPYNGFKVTAHRGEAILSRVEADNYRANKNTGNGVIINIHDPVVREESDLDRLGTLFANKLSEVRGNMGALGFA